jgi:TP901 family phage tail tape measure protein
MADIEKRIQYIVEVQDRATSVMRDIGIASGVMGAAIVASLGVSAKLASDFESSFAGVRKTVDASEEEFAQLAKNFRELSKEIPVNVNALNRIAELAGQLGVRGVTDLTKFTDTVAKIAVTTNLTEEIAATSFARIANITREPITNIDRMASSVVDLGNNFATTESEIVEFATRMSGAGKIAGLTTAEIFGIAAAFSSVGIEAEAGGTAIQKVLLDMNAQGKRGIGEFTKFVQNLTAAGTDASKVLEELGFTDVRLQRAFLSVAGASGILEDAIKTSTDAFVENNALSEEAAKRFATFESQLQIFRNTISDLGITIGNAVLPVLNAILSAVTPVISAIGNAAAAFPGLTAAIVIVVGVIGTLLVVLSSLSFLGMGVVGTISTMTLAFGGGAVGAAGFAAALSALVPILAVGGALVLALTGIITLIVTVTQHWEGLKWMIGSFAVATVETITGWIGTIRTLFDVAWTVIRLAFSTGTAWVSDQWNAFLDGLKNAVMAPVDAIRSAFEDVFSWISNTIGAVMSKISGAIDAVRKVIPGAANSSRVRGRATGGMMQEPLTLVGENGPELISAPGSRVHNAQETREMLGSKVEVHVHVSGGMIGVSSREIVSQLGDMIMRQLNLTTNHA